MIIGALQNNKRKRILKKNSKKQNLYNSFGEIYRYSKKRLFKKFNFFKSETTKQDPIDWMSYIDLKIWLGRSFIIKS